MRRLRFTFAALGLAATASLADRPLATNNADVHEGGTCVAEAGIERVTVRGGPSASGQGVSFACGIGWLTEVGAGWARATSAGSSARTYGISGKSWLVERKGDRAGLSLGWGVDWLSAAGSGSRREGSFLNGIYSQQVADGLILHANLGWSRSRSARQDSTTWGIAAEKGLGGGLELLGEVFGVDRDASPWVNIGLRWALVPEKFFLDAAWAMQTSSSRPKAAAVGLRVEF